MKLEILYIILNELKSKKNELEKDLNMKEIDTKYLEVKNVLYGLSLAEKIICNKISELEK